MDGGEKVLERGGGADGAIAIGVLKNGLHNDERFGRCSRFNLPR
jgi:hypothetical protein